MDITFSDEYELIPEWNDNRSSSEPIKFKCNYLTLPQKQACLKTDFVVEGGVSKMRIMPDNNLYFKTAVKSIENLSVKGYPIKTVDEFMKQKRLGGLFNEIVSCIINTESDGENKIKN